MKTHISGMDFGNLQIITLTFALDKDKYLIFAIIYMMYIFKFICVVLII